MMGGLELVSARRKGKPSRIQCLSYIKTQFQDESEKELPRERQDMFSSKDERHDDPNDPSSDDSESDDDVNEYDRRRAF